MGGKNKKRSEMTEEELERIRAYHREWMKKKRKEDPETAKKWESNRDKDKRRERQRRDYHKDGRGRSRAKRYRENHKEEINTRRRTARRLDPALQEDNRRRAAKWREDNPEAYDTQQKQKYQNKRFAIHEHYMQKKLQCSQYIGGKCEMCGSEDLITQVFHHRNPEEKSYGIATQIRTLSFDELKPELDKCDLLCSNCHITKHHELAWG